MVGEIPSPMAPPIGSIGSMAPTPPRTGGTSAGGAESSAGAAKAQKIEGPAEMVRSESSDVYGHGMTCIYIYYIDIYNIYIDRIKYMYVYRLFCIHVQTISLCICIYITYTLIISVGINDFN